MERIKKIRLLKVVKILLMWIILFGTFNFEGYYAILNNPLKSTGHHEEIDDVGNKYYYSNSDDYEGYGDFRANYKNGETYKLKYDGKIYEETALFITIDQDISGISGSTVVFCVEPDKTAIYVEDTDEASSAYTNLSEVEKLEVSKIVTASTNLYSKSGNYDYLLACQLLVWEAVGAELLEIPSSVKSESDEIKNLVADYSKVPSFLETEDTFYLEYNENSSRYELYLEDTNDVLDEFFLDKLVGQEGEYNIEDGPSDNDLYIWADKYTPYTQVIKAEQNLMPEKAGQKANIKYEVEPIFVNSGQDLVAGINYVNRIQFNLNVKAQKGSATLKKCGVNEEECIPLSNAMFGLYDENDNLLEQRITDTNGEITFNDLNLGAYYVKEIEAPSPYAVNDNKYEFTITNDNLNVNINDGNYIEDDLVSGSIYLRKVGIKNNKDTTLYPLEGVEFTIYKDSDLNGTLEEADEVFDVIKTDANGEIYLDNIPYGSYIIKETKAIDGYVNNGYEEAFAVDESDDNIKLYSGLDLVNDVVKGKVDLYKIGKDCQECTKIPLSEVEFIIYQDLNSNGEIDEEDIELETLITDDKGYVISNDLIYGDYLIKEVSTVPGYELSDDVYPFSIEEEKVAHLNNGEEITNYSKLKEINIFKKDQFENPVENATFKLYEDVNNNSKVDNEDVLVGDYTTNINGNITISDLRYGSYIFYESTAPQGYILDDTEYSFVINDEVFDEDLSFEVKNDLILSNIKLIKKDNETKELLEGVDFNFYNDKNLDGKISTDELVGQYETDENGEIIIEDVIYGNYIFQEDTPLDGYEQDETLYTVNVDGSEDEYVVEVYNQKIYEKVVQTLVNTSNNKHFRKTVLIVSVSVLIIYIVLKVKYKDKNYI